MNQMQLYAKCVTIRDAQIEEKKHMMLEEEEEERRLDLMMEIERLKVGRNGPGRRAPRGLRLKWRVSSLPGNGALRGQGAPAG